jgi:hypothetical protein
MELSIVGVCEKTGLLKLVCNERSESRFSGVVHKLKFLGLLICSDTIS